MSRDRNVEDELVETLDPIPVEQIAETLERIAEAAEALLEAGLTRPALVQLVKLAAPRAVRLGEIETVLEALPRLRDLLEEPSS